MNWCIIVILLCCCCRGDRRSVCCTEASCEPEIPCERERLICSQGNDEIVSNINAASIEISEEPAIINEWKL